MKAIKINRDGIFRNIGRFRCHFARPPKFVFLREKTKYEIKLQNQAINRFRKTKRFHGTFDGSV